MREIAVFILSYLIGSVLIGDIVAKIKRVDLRGQGSGNVGATNVFRTMGPLWGAVVLLGDTLKGVVAVLLGNTLGSFSGFEYAILTGILAIAGHNWSIFAGFRGGKGVATSLGVAIALTPLSLVGTIPAWLGVFFLSGYVSLASVIAVLSYPLFVYIFYPGHVYLLIFAALIAILAVYKHRANIRRLRQGTESRILYKRKGAESK